MTTALSLGKSSSPDRKKLPVPAKKKSSSVAKRKPKRKITKKEVNVDFDYLKGNFFRTIHADGAIGSVTSLGYIHMAFFSERPAIPQRITQKGQLDESTGAVLLGDKRDTISRNSIVREMEVDVMFDIKTANKLQQWLGERIKELETHEQVLAKFGKEL